MRAILVTGMSGTGKSTALAELRRRGFETVDTDEPGWSDWDDADGGYLWRLPSRSRSVHAPPRTRL